MRWSIEPIGSRISRRERHSGFRGRRRNVVEKRVWEVDDPSFLLHLFHFATHPHSFPTYASLSSPCQSLSHNEQRRQLIAHPFVFASTSLQSKPFGGFTNCKDKDINLHVLFRGEFARLNFPSLRHQWANNGEGEFGSCKQPFNSPVDAKLQAICQNLANMQKQQQGGSEVVATKKLKIKQLIN
ncbi:hypothetical protein Sjap_002783 [Stephania japonica]|uniref:Uncharacterized protein n=1 Tax=Stephania japonica TaxID=461633 RepID=A0AAP0PSV8_9MAGN